MSKSRQIPAFNHGFIFLTFLNQTEFITFFVFVNRMHKFLNSLLSLLVDQFLYLTSSTSTWIIGSICSGLVLLPFSAFGRILRSVFLILFLGATVDTHLGHWTHLLEMPWWLVIRSNVIATISVHFTVFPLIIVICHSHAITSIVAITINFNTVIAWVRSCLIELLWILFRR